MKLNPIGLARVLLGGIFLFFGLNGFLHFLPSPPLTGRALAFVGGLAASGYFFPLLKGTEIAAGLLLLSGRYVPLALTVLAPIVVNILAFHAFLVPDLGIPLIVLALEVFLAWSYRGAFRSVLQARFEPEPIRVRVPRTA